MISNWILDIKREFDLYNVEDNLSFAYSIMTNPEGFEQYVYLNTVSATELVADNYISENLYGHIVNLHVDDTCTEPFTINLSISVRLINDGDVQYKNISKVFQYKPYVLPGYTPDKERFNKFVNGNVSYQLLRVNPKLTGNVKVVVTEDSKLYLDTFKVSLALGQYKYRHIPLNVNTYYGRSLMNAFRKMSVDDFYKVEDNCYNLFTTVNDYKLQYYDTYNSGVRTNNDNLYKENFAMLAPLCVKHVLPDFFLVFKVKTDEFNKRKNMSETDKIKYFFENGTLVKSFDMRKDSNLGTYIREMQRQSETYPGDIFVAYDKTNYNKFIGISVDRGVVTSAYESIYKEDGINNQVAYNEYFTMGFQRNKLVSKDIVNFEFMFNDTDEKLFSINTYFGIYVRLNGEHETFSCIGHDDVYEFDVKDLHNFEAGTSLYGENNELIYGISTPDKFIRLKETIYDSSIMENYKLRPYRSIVTGDYHDIAEQTPYEYMVITLNKKIKSGEHFRIIDLRHTTIYDVIATEYTKYLDRNNVSEVSYNYIWHNKVRFTIKSVSAYFGESEQAEQMFFAFNKMKSGIYVSWNDNNVVFKAYAKGLIFEKVSAFSDYSTKKLNNVISYDEDNESVKFFDAFYPEKVVIDLSESLDNNDYFYLYPFYTNAVGSRLMYVCNFVEVKEEGLRHTVQSNIISDIGDHRTVLYRESDGNAKVYQKFKIQYIGTDNGEIVHKETEVQYLLSPMLDDNYIINVTDPMVYNGQTSLYSSYPINSGLCSILPLKDFNFEVLDSDTRIDYFIGDRKPIGDSGEFTKNSVFDDNGVSSKTEEYVTDYFDMYRKYDNCLYNIYDASALYNGLREKSDKDTYYSQLLANAHLYSDISLIAPYVCKWESNGTDARCEKMRVMYDYDKGTLKDVLSYYVPYSKGIFSNSLIEASRSMELNMYDTHLGCLQSELRSSANKYINQDITGLLIDTNVDSGISIRDGIINGRISIDDILYNSDSYRDKFSRVYKSGENTIEFISGGIKFKIHSYNDDILNFNTYGTYQAIFISVPGHNSAHSRQMELIVDEINEQIALIYYQNIKNINIGAQPQPELAYEIPHYSTLQKSKCVVIGNQPCLKTPTDDLGYHALRCDEVGYYVLENEQSYNIDEYSMRNNVSLISKVNPHEDFTYDTVEGYTVTEEPVIMHGNEIDVASNYLIDSNADIFHDAIKAYVITDSETYDTRKIKSLDDLKMDAVSCAVYVRKQDGAKDYTNVEDVLTIDIIPPYLHNKIETEKYVTAEEIENHDVRTKGFVHTTYASPLMKDMLTFEYRDANLNSSLGLVLDGMNIRISGANSMQRWINKYTDVIDYCIPIDSSYPKLSLDYVNGVSLLDNCWNDIYKKYVVNGYVGNEEADYAEYCEKIMGYETGYEANRFLHSRGINLNGIDGREVEITVWKNTKINEREQYIKLDITESLIYKILFAKGYSESWKYLNLRSNTHKIKYIKNTILPLINITDNTVFRLYKIENTSKLLFKDLNSMADVVEVENVKHELKYENGKYYMYVYPEYPHTYYAKMYIEL